MNRVADSTTIPEADSGTRALERPLRLVSLGVIATLTVATAIGLLGVRTAEVTASGGGMLLTVDYSVVTRPGLATPFSVEVARVGGSALPAELTVRVSSDYLAIFDDNGMEPQPAESFNTSEWTWWVFDVPDGATSLRVDLDARLEPAVQWARSGVVAVDVGEVEAVAAGFTTWVAP
ncbi:MAG TPA: hypothetical protein VI141_01970 [Acidimicrobiia bacterium]